MHDEIEDLERGLMRNSMPAHQPPLYLLGEVQDILSSFSISPIVIILRHWQAFTAGNFGAKQITWIISSDCRETNMMVIKDPAHVRYKTLIGYRSFSSDDPKVVYMTIYHMFYVQSFMVLRTRLYHIIMTRQQYISSLYISDL